MSTISKPTHATDKAISPRSAATRTAIPDWQHCVRMYFRRRPSANPIAIGARSWSAHFYNHAKNNAGTSAIEFAFTFPVFIILALGILSYGIYFGAAHSVAQLAADAARVSIAGLSDTERATLAEQHVAAHVEGFAFLEQGKVTTSAAASPDDADQFTVAVRFDASNLPIWAFAGIVPLPSKVIERSSTIRRGGQ